MRSARNSALPQFAPVDQRINGEDVAVLAGSGHVGTRFRLDQAGFAEAFSLFNQRDDAFSAVGQRDV